ncbi:MAG: S-layer homology domain-containing protein [Clostridia bacterium]|nr:S-layer homology domain-containing protein [Clostridia bacterium]
MKRILSLLITAVFVFTSGVTVFADDSTTAAGTAAASAASPTLKFADVDETTEEGKAIYKLVEAGVVNGNGDGTFGPKSGLTRAELCKMVNLVFGYKEADTVQFTDVKSDDWFAPYVLVAKKAGYITGYDDGTFRGNNNITREEFCAILCRVANLYDLGLKAIINDKVSDWAYVYVNKVVTNSLMSLEDGKTFRATENMKRGEIAVVLARFVKATTTATTTTQATVSTGGGTRRPSGGGGGLSSSGSSSSKDDEESSDDSNNSTSDDSSTGDSAGDDTEQELTPKEYEEINKDIIERLTKAKTALSNNKNKFRGTERTIVNNIISVIDKIIADAGKYEISYDSVLTNYTDEIADTYTLYSEMPEISRSNFKTKVADIDEETFEFLMEFFGISDDI